MNLLNPAVAVVSAILGTVGATVAYQAADVAPIEHPQPAATPERFTVYLPCEAPSVLKDGNCVTTVVKTVVKTPEPRVIVLEAPKRPRKSSGGSSSKTASSHEREDHESDDDHEDHEPEDGD